MAKFKVFNSKGEEVVLNKKEQVLALRNQKIVNDLGYKIDITSLTTIMKEVVEQKFYEIPFADFVPTRVGEGAWSQFLTTYRSFSVADDFEKGIIATGSGNARLAVADAGVDAVNIPVANWAKSIHWSLPDLQMAMKSGNWDLITAKEQSRKKNWDLGLQKIAFIGSDDGLMKGLLNQSGVTVNTTLITEYLSGMTATELSSFAAQVLGVYRTNCAKTAWPTHFAIPEADYLGLATPSSDTYPVKSKLELLQDTFKIMTKNPNFQILPVAYGEAALNPLNKACYALYKYDAQTIRMDIPVDYTNTLANSVDNFMFQNVGLGQFTGVNAYRPKEVLYFQF